MVAGGALDGLTEKVPPLQIVAGWFGMTGFGFMVTVTVKLAPGQPPADGVMVYTAVWGVLVVFVNVPVMEDTFVPEAPPENPEPDGADQLYVVPAGTKVVGGVLVGVIVNVLPLQIIDV
jgi:hypothetical protein